MRALPRGGGIRRALPRGARRGGEKIGERDRELEVRSPEIICASATAGVAAGGGCGGFCGRWRGSGVRGPGKSASATGRFGIRLLEKCERYRGGRAREGSDKFCERYRGRGVESKVPKKSGKTYIQKDGRGGEESVEGRRGRGQLVFRAGIVI